MKANVGGFDGAARTLVFIVTVVIGIMTGQWWWAVIGLIFFATAALTWCPLYEMFGINTNKNRRVSH